MSSQIDQTSPGDNAPQARPKEKETLYLRCVYSQGMPPDDTLRDDLLTFERMGQEVVIGRVPDQGTRKLALAHDGWASRNHAAFVRLAGPDGEPALVVKDLRSRNGTCVDGSKIHAATPLRVGQAVRVGASLFVVGSAPMARRHRLLQQSPPPPNYQARTWSGLALWERALQLAATSRNIFLLGELGTGKTRLAQIIHEHSPRRAQPFFPFNCSAVPPTLEEATLFGATAGSIPGGKASAGIIAQAGQGTLLLDEVSELPLLAQAKLLEAFDPSALTYLQVGGTQRLKTRCRLIMASNRDLDALAERGEIRHDLVSRLVGGELTIPPLRERREDVVALFETALARYAPQHDINQVIHEVEIAEALVIALWTENVRGLEALARRVGNGEHLTDRMIRQHSGRSQISEDAPTEVMASPDADTAPGVSGPPAVLWPPTPSELLTLLNQKDWSVTKVAAHFGRSRATVGRYVTQTFGFGGKKVAKQAFRVLEASGRAPVGPEIGLAYALFFERTGPEYDASRERWKTLGKL